MSIFKGKIQVHEEALDVLQMVALSSLGHYIAKNNVDWIDDMESWYAGFQKLTEPESVDDAFKHAVHTVLEKFIEDKFVQLQVETLMAAFQIDLDVPALPEVDAKYRKIVDAFMAGVKTAK